MQMPARLYSLVLEAYKMIGNLTPVPADCGKLCGAACCEGDDDLGMLLFPGEAARLASVPRFKVTRIRYMDSNAWLLICSGNCDRELRPLSCRIFPLAPHVSPNGTVTAIPDPRGWRMCPLSGGEYLDRRFVKAVNSVFKHLAQEPRMLDFMRDISDELDDIINLRRIL